MFYKLYQKKKILIQQFIHTKLIYQNRNEN